MALFLPWLKPPGACAPPCSGKPIWRARGAVTELALAADAKQEAFAVFSDACQAWPTDAQRSDDDRGSLRALVLAASENTTYWRQCARPSRGSPPGCATHSAPLPILAYMARPDGAPYHVPAARFDASA